LGIFITDSLNLATPNRINLTENARVFLTRGELTIDDIKIQPEADPDVWKELTNNGSIDASWSIYKSGLVDDDKQPFLSLSDRPAEYFTYLIRFNLSQSKFYSIQSTPESFVIYFPSISDNRRIILNGRTVHEDIDVNEDGEITAHHNDTGFILPFEKLNLNHGENNIIINVLVSPNYADSGLYVKGDYIIDEERVIRNENTDIFYVMLAGIAVFMAFYNFLIYANSSEEKFYLFFGIVGFLFAFYIISNLPYAHMFFENSRIPNLTEYISLLLMPVFVLLFTSSILGKKIPIPMRAVMGAEIALCAAMPLVGQQCTLDLLIIGEILVIVSLIYTFAIGVKFVVDAHCKKNTKHNKTESVFRENFVETVLVNTVIGVFLAGLMAVVGVIQSNILGSNENGVIIGLFVFVLSITFSLIDDVIQTKQLAFEQNEDLNAVVEKRTVELRHQTIKALAANESKSRFLSAVSSEIKNPMNAIIGISEIKMKDKSSNEEDRDAFSRINSSGVDLLLLMDNILDYSDADSGKMTFKEETYDIAELIFRLTVAAKSRISGRDIELLYDLDAALPRFITGDIRRTKQALAYLISNAVDSIDKGRVAITIMYEPSDKNPSIVFFIACSGSDDENRDKKSADSLDDELQLDKELAERIIILMGGEIVFDRTDIGDVVSVRINPHTEQGGELLGRELRNKLSTFRYIPEDSYTEPVIREIPRTKILIVDDDENSRYVLTGFLRQLKADTSEVPDGFNAVAFLRSGYSYDLIFLDERMPKMGGIETAKIIRSLGYTGKIVLLTSNDFTGKEEKLAALGFCDNLMKPITMKKLSAIINKCFWGG
jgi:signal transduction histidine kinase/CheY-like chemotaxis protein